MLMSDKYKHIHMACPLCTHLQNTQTCYEQKNKLIFIGTHHRKHYIDFVFNAIIPVVILLDKALLCSHCKAM